MNVPPPAPNFCSFSVSDASARGALQEEAFQQDVELLAQLRGPPQTEKLLLCLTQTLTGVTRKNANFLAAKKKQTCSLSTTSIDSDETGKLSFFQNSNEADLDGDCVIQEAFLDDLCLYLSSGASSLEQKQQEDGAFSVLQPLPIPISGRSNRQEIKAMFTRLAEGGYWRRALLIPLLRRWLQNGSYFFFTSLLLHIVTDVIGKKLLSFCSLNLRDTTGDEVKANDAGACVEQHKSGAGAMRELEELIKATGSFRGLCIGIDAILRANIVRLVGLVKSIFLKGDFKNEKKDTLTGCARAEVERVVEASTLLTWKDVFAFLSRCVADVHMVFCESLWMFLMTLLSGYMGTFHLLELRPCETNIGFDLVESQAQRMFVEGLRRDLLNHLTVRLSRDRVASGKSLITLQNILCAQPFFWTATMEVELAPELLPDALVSKPDVYRWARGLAATAWCAALRLVQTLVHGQDAVEEVPSLGEGAESVTLSIRQCQRQLLEEHVERLASVLLERFGNPAQSCKVEVNSGAEDLAFAASWSTYTSEFFLRTYHPSCFTILSLVEQDSLVGLLRQLHAIITNKEREAVGLSITQFVDSYVDAAAGELQWQEKRETEKALLKWHSSCIHKRMVQAFKDDALLIMCLLRAVFVFFDRIGKTNLDVHDVLRKTFLPVLTSLCANCADCGTDNNGDDEDNVDDIEKYYESQQAIMMLLVSGFSVLPWDIREIRVRLLLHRAIGESLQDCFSAEEALSEVDNLFIFYTGDSQDLEKITVSLGVNLASDPFIQFLTAEGEGSSLATDTIDDLLRSETPVHFPAPCGALLLMSVFRTLSLRLLQLRAEWEQQLRLLGDDTKYYLGRQATFCTTRDIAVFRLLVHLAHHMVLGFQVQSVGLLRMWLSYLSHLFTNIVPPLTEDDEIVFLAPNKTQKERNGSGDFPRRAYRRSQNETSQGELRVVLGELLADLAVMPLVDSEAAMQCPAALPHRPGGEKWQRQQSQRMQDILVLQRVLPTLLLEEMCFALKIQTEDLSGHGLCPKAARLAGKAVDQSFLGSLGLVVFCRRFELFVVPESFTDKRCAALLQVLWSAVEASSMTTTT